MIIPDNSGFNFSWESCSPCKSGNICHLKDGSARSTSRRLTPSNAPIIIVWDRCFRLFSVGFGYFHLNVLIGRAKNLNAKSPKRKRAKRILALPRPGHQTLIVCRGAIPSCYLCVLALNPDKGANALVSRTQSNHPGQSKSCQILPRKCFSAQAPRNFPNPPGLQTLNFEL